MKRNIYHPAIGFHVGYIPGQHYCSRCVRNFTCSNKNVTFSRRLILLAILLLDGVSLHLHTDGDRFLSHMCRNFNYSRFAVVEFTNTSIGQ